jgi:hypothetical protein
MAVDRASLEEVARRLKRRELTKAELQQRLEEHVRDRLWKEATHSTYATNIEQAGVHRRSFAERLEAYKWVAAISTAAFVLLAQTLAGGGPSMRAEAGTAALIADFGFLCSLVGAASYMFVIDTRASSWYRSIFVRTSHVLSLLAGMDASAEEIRDGLERDDLKAANDAFWSMIESKLNMGREMSAQGPSVPREGWLAGLVGALCVGGLVVGLLAASIYQWETVLAAHS